MTCHQLAGIRLETLSGDNQASRHDFSRKYDYQRGKCEDPVIICNWVKLAKNTIVKHGIQRDDFSNVDETGFMMGLIQNGMVVTGIDRRGKPKSVQPRNREWITVIQRINVDDRAIPPFIIGARQHRLATWYRERNLLGNLVIVTA
ncbi:hypothetical protein HOO65_050521 [Ceratocystis lukuohia]|uniref:Transposase n=1 Tax=Ceratocystis lukuohia TaxID=2019550 RepID=A0ABR4MGI5_9PEZI